MQSVEAGDLDRLIKRVDDTIQQFPEKKEKALKEAGEAMLSIVRLNVSTSPMADDGAKVGGWQRAHVGTKKGYAAVRAIGGKEGGGTGPESAGAVTNYTENGHAIRRPAPVKRKGYRYRPRIHKPRVPGYHYYYYTDGPAQQAGAAAVAGLGDELARELGGENG